MGKTYHGGPYTIARDFNLLYRAPLVRAFLAGLKTQTRRLMKPQPMRKSLTRDFAWYWRSARYDNGAGVRYFHTQSLDGVRAAWARANPYGPPGSTMHARENYWRNRLLVDERVVYAATPELARHKTVARGNGMVFVTYHEQGTQYRCTRAQAQEDVATNEFWSLHPNIHMPAWACRIRATLVSVEPEQAWSISNADARAEGIPVTADIAGALGLLDVEAHEWDSSTSAENFLRLFHGINRSALTRLPRAQSPWVWKLTLRDVVVDMPEHAALPYLVVRDDQHALPIYQLYTAPESGT